MHVLTLISSPTLTGPAAPLLQFARRLNEGGASVTVASDSLRRGDLLQWIRRFGLDCWAGPTLSTVARPDQYLGDARRLAKWLGSNRPDCVLAALSNDLITARAASWLSKTAAPIVAYHGFGHDPPGLRRRLLLRLADGLIAPAIPGGRAGGFDPARVFPLPPDVDRERFRPAGETERRALRRRLGFGPRDRVAGSVGRFKPGRGQLELVEAFARVERDCPALRLLMVGWGEDLPLCRWRAAQLGLQSKIRFTGFLSEELPDAYRAMDAFLLAAVGRDCLGRAVLEAMACAVPVWTIDYPAAAGAVRAAGAGGVFSTADVRGLAGVLKEIAAAKLAPQTGLRLWIESLPGGAVARDFTAWMENGLVDKAY